MLIGLLLATLLVLAVLALGGYRRRVRGGTYALKKLAENIAKGRLQPRDACCDIRRITQPLQVFVASHPQHQDDWQRFREQLLEGCFSPDPPALEEVQHLVAQAMEWLKAMERY
ncbi:hypothetical protein [Thiolapillus brandeum]|uniref:DUF2489 domain-containing protein n=1 Tax=Thiolapillus brandeum TaxID=1076588 RepID=A0A7U6GJV1_9GAMM|nr:hypothetical protein [Thiolapillus brandeum]BAO44938.1 hypothetical protein TBH_C2024 [Thiolapillus brandeum]